MRLITTANAPKAIGPYSQAVISGKFVFTSGQIAIDSKTNEFINGTIEEQIEIIIKNIASILESAGSSLAKVVKVNVYLADINDFVEMNKIYEKHFTSKPARATIQAAKLPKGAKIEMDVIAEV